MTMKLFKIFFAAAVVASSLTSCVVDPYFYSGYSSYSGYIHESPTYHSYNYSCYNNQYYYPQKRRNVIPLDGSPPPNLRGRVFRGGDGFLYLEQY